jgi:hypothetical protein
VNRELAALKAAFRLGMKQDMVRRVPDISIQSEQGREKNVSVRATHLFKFWRSVLK